MNHKTLGKTFERLQSAKACGIPAAEAWQAIRQGVDTKKEPRLCAELTPGASPGTSPPRCADDAPAAPPSWITVKMRPSVKAMMLGTAWEYLVEIYGVEETANLRKFLAAPPASDRTQ